MIETSDSSCILDYDFEKLLENGATTLATLQQNGQVESIEAELDAKLKLVIETAVEKENPPMLNGNGSALDHNQQIEPKSCGFGISYLQQLGPSVLILGDGNLSFSLTLSRLYPRCRIIATVFEEQDEWMEKYGEIGKNILEKIKNEFPETKVQFEVDATRLKEWPFTKRTFSDIIFNFPHHGGKTNLKKSRAFLRNIFSSIADNLMSSRKRNHLHITLAPGQSGIDPEMVSNGQIFAANPPEHSLDSWQPLEIAAESGLIAVGVRKFDTTLLPGYSSSGYLSSNKAFHNAGDSHTIVFNWIGPLPKNVRLRLASAKYIESVGQRIRTAEPFDGVFQPIFNQFRPFHEYHLSIVFGKSHPCEDEEYMAKLTDNLFRLCHQFAAPFLVSIFELPEKRCLAPQRLPNRIYCLQYQGLAVPLYKELANCVHADVHLALRQELEESNTDIRVS